MEIHDLNTGTPASSHYVALDSGTYTYKATLEDLYGKTVETLNQNWLNMNFIKVNSGVKFARCSTYPNSAMTANTEYSVGTLSAAYRPTYTVNHMFLFNTSQWALLKITTAGVVTFTPSVNVSTTTGININLAYM